MILTFAYPSSPQYTGGVVSLYEFANALARRGQEVHFAHGPVWPGRIDHLDQISWFPFDPRIVHHIVDDFDDPRLPAGDVAFSPTLPRRLGLPAVFVQGHGMIPPAIERDVFRARCPKVCIARWLLDVGTQQYGVPPEQLWHVPMGMDHTLFRPATPLDQRDIDVLLLYNVHPSKGWEFAAEALEAVRQRRPGVRVEVFGIVPPERPVAGWLRYHLAPDRQSEIPALYNRARVFLQPSVVEGFGFSAVEAMACGCALVSTDNGGSQDYAVPGQTAEVVPPKDPVALAQAILRLLDDDALRQRLARTGAEHVRRFDWERAGAQLEHHLVGYVADPDRYRRPCAPMAEETDARAG